MNSEETRRLRELGYELLPLPPRDKWPPPKGWLTHRGPYEIPEDANVGLALRGDVAVLITNDEAATRWALDTFGDPHVRSVRGGHWYFRARKDQANEGDKHTAVGRIEFHVRSKYVVIPPSIHPTGTAYSWVRPLSAPKDLPEAPDIRELWHPGGEHHTKLLAMSSAAAHAGKSADEIFGSLRKFRDDHLVDALGHPDRELRQLADSAASKFNRPGSTQGAPPLDEFDPEVGEVFRAINEAGEPELGIAWVEGHQLHRTTLRAELARIQKTADSAKSRPGGASREEMTDAERKTKRLVESLPFNPPTVKASLWPLPEDPTVESTSQWEARHGPLLDVLRTYFSERVCAEDPDAHLLMALWAMGASARSDAVDFAPRLMIEAPYGWGKSSTAESVQLVVPRSVYGAAITPAAAHRVMNENHPVLLVDESAIADNPELQRVLRAGFKRGARIIRAAQNQDRGVVMIDPFGWVILTTQVDTKDDLVSRCYQISTTPGTPARRVSHKDPEATKLRTALARLRLDILLGAEYPRLAEDTEAAQTHPGLEPRSRDKLSALWPYALRYGIQDRLAATAARLEEESTKQLAGSDKGLVANAVGLVVANSGGLAKLRASDLDLVVIQQALESILVDMGEATVIPIGGGEVERRVDLKRYGPRDFTARLLRELGLRLKTVEGRARIELKHFLAVWPTVSARYTGNTTLDEYSAREAPSAPLEGGSVMPPPPTVSGGTPPKTVGYRGGPEDPRPADVENGENGGIRRGPEGSDPPTPARAGPADKPPTRTSENVRNWDDVLIRVRRERAWWLECKARYDAATPEERVQLVTSEKFSTIGPFVEYPVGTVAIRRSGDEVWAPGDPVEYRPSNPTRDPYDRPHTPRRF